MMIWRGLRNSGGEGDIMEKETEAINLPDDFKELGRFYLLHQQFQKAIEFLKKADESTDIPDPEIYYLLGLAYESIRNYDEARAYYEKALHYDDSFTLAKERLEKIVGK